MTELGPVARPSAPIRTGRLVLREPKARDRAAVIGLFASPEVGTNIGGPRQRHELERVVPEVPRARPGSGANSSTGSSSGGVRRLRAVA